jgi:hypothetical protein
VYIYTLADPRNGEVRYVGKTNNKKLRSKAHRNERGSTRKCRWVQSLSSAGVCPVFEELEEVEENEWKEAERFWIASLRFYGFRLVNASDGGDGNNQSPEARAKIAAAMTGRKWDRETIERRTKHFKGVPKTPEHRAKISAAHIGKHHLSAESKARISAARKGKPLTIEHRAKLCAAHQRRRLARQCLLQYQ